MPEQPPDHEIPALDGSSITLEEIQQVMAEEGYVADQRKGWLKQVLTELTSASPEGGDERRAALIEAVKAIISDQQDDPPIADDVL